MAYEEQVVKAYAEADTGNFPKPDLTLITAAECVRGILAYRCEMDEEKCAITVLAVANPSRHDGTGLIVSPSGKYAKGQKVFNALLGWEHWAGDTHEQFRPYRHWGVYHKPRRGRTTACGEPKALSALQMGWPGWRVTGYCCFWFTTVAEVTIHSILSNHRPNERYMTPCASCKRFVMP
jgi:hypothetical protein